MKTFFSATELANLRLPEIPKTKKGIILMANRENWQSRPRKGRGGGLEYDVNSLPKSIQAAIQTQQAEKLLAQTAPEALPVLPETPDARQDALSGSTAAQRNQEGARLAVLKEVEKLMTQTGVGKDAAITTLLTAARHPDQPHLAAMLAAANDKRGGGGNIPSSRTIKR